MKKKLLFGLIPFLAFGTLVACGAPTPSEPKDPEPELGQAVDVYFFLNYNDVDYDHPYTIRSTFQNGFITPPSIEVTSADAPDPAFPTFLGWSTHTLVDDEKDIWDFENDRVPDTAIIYMNLYATWVSETSDNNLGTNHIYLHTGGNRYWSTKDGEGRSPHFAAWVSKIGEPGKYVDLVQNDTNANVYEATLDDYYTDIQFLRMNPSYTRTGDDFPPDNTETVPGIWNRSSLIYSRNNDQNYWKVTGWGESDGVLGKWDNEQDDPTDTSGYGRVDSDEGNSTWYIVGDGLFLNDGATWNKSGGIQLTEKENPQYSKAEAYATVKFAKDDIWKITNGTTWIQMDCLEQCPVMTSEDMTEVNDGNGGYNIKVQTSGTYTIFFKVFDNAATDGRSGYSLWIEYGEVK